MTLRVPQDGDLPRLTELAMRSKAHWGYSADFMQACRDELTLTPGKIQGTRLCLLDADDRIAGFAQISIEADVADLLMMFVEPDLIGHGYGRRLFDWAAATSRSHGADRMTIEADPFAAPFYERMGARQVGEVASVSIPGRNLPLLELDLTGSG